MKPGRVSKYITHVLPNLDRVPKLKKQGYHDEQIAAVLGVGYSTFNSYILLYPELKEALKKGKQELVEDLEDTLYRKALGRCSIKEVKKYIEKDKNGESKTKIEEVTKEIAPDTGALIFCLKNLAPDRWKDVHEATFNEMSKAMDNFKSFSEQMDVIDKEIKKDDPDGKDTAD